MTPIRLRSFVSLLLAASFASPAIAQEAEPSSRHEIGQPGERITDDDTSLATATDDPTPAAVAPSFDQPVELDVVEQAGVGGPVPYAAANVLETGGTASLSIDDLSAAGVLRPYVGWFPVDGFELTYANDLAFRYAGDQIQAAFAATVEPSGHFPVAPRLWIALGCGLGILWNGSDAGFEAVPRVGLDVLVGRSGMLHVSVLGTIATAPLFSIVPGDQVAGHWRVGGELGYSVLF